MSEETQIRRNTIVNFLFFKDGKFNIFKTIQNVLRICVLLCYLKFIYELINTPSQMKLIKFEDPSISIVIALYSMLCYVFTLIIFLLALTNSRILKAVNVLLFGIICFIYRISAHNCANMLCLIEPIIFLPICLSFVIIFHKMKYFDVFFMLLFLIPILYILIGTVIALPSHSYCRKNVKYASYNAIEIPNKFFHTKEDKIKPNIWIGSVNLKQKYENQIIYIPCLHYYVGTLEKLLKNNIILCYYHYDDEFIITQYKGNNEYENLVSLKFMKKEKKNNFNLFFKIPNNNYSCTIRLTDKDLLNSIPTEHYLKAMKSK